MKSILRSAVATSVVASVALMATMAARAADLPPAPAPMARAPVAYVPVAAPFSWTGFYLGGNLGAARNHGSIADTFGLYSWGVNNQTTFVGGAQVGGNYQFNSFVVGVEGDFDWFANNNNSGGGTAIAGLGGAGTTISGSNNGRWLTTLTGRFGFAVDRVLLYAKGGGAWVGSSNLTLLNVSNGATVSIGNGNTNTGWVVGAGVEYAFLNNWTAKVEYDYVGLSNYSFTVPGTFPVAAVAGDTFSTSSRNVQMVTLGINYLFNGF
jgi:outer membrane immunogenic protein